MNCVEHTLPLKESTEENYRISVLKSTFDDVFVCNCLKAGYRSRRGLIIPCDQGGGSLA